MAFIVINNLRHILMCLFNLENFYIDIGSTKSFSCRTSAKQVITPLNRKNCTANEVVQVANEFVLNFRAMN